MNPQVSVLPRSDEVQSVTTERRLKDVVWIAVVSLVMGAVLFLDIAQHNPEYLRNVQTNANPDARHYVVLGRNIWEKGEYSRQEVSPYVPDMLRTPIYPILAGALDLTGGAWAIYGFQLLCRTATAAALYWFGSSLFGRRVGLVAALLLAVDPMLAVLDFEAMSESLFTLLATLAVLLWFVDLFGAKARHRSTRGALVGVLLGLAILTRPAGLYLPIVLAVNGVCLALGRSSRAFLGHVLAMALSAALLIAPWIWRNAQVFGVARLTTADTINLVYFAGAGAYSVERDIPLTEAQEVIRSEFGIVSLLHSNNHWHADRSVAQMDREQRRIVRRLLTRYPCSLVIASLTGVGKSAIAHNVDSYAQMTGRTWHSPGLDQLVRGNVGDFVRRLSTNSPILIALFIGEMLSGFVLLFAGIVGLLVGLRSSPRRPVVICLVVIAGYYIATICVVGVDAYARHRAILVPLGCLLAAIGLLRPRDLASQTLRPQARAVGHG